MKPNKKRTYLILIVVSIIIIIAVVLKVKNYMDQSSRRPQITPNVVLANPAKKAISNFISLTGDVNADQQANIYSRVSGNIEKVFVDIGQYVQRGQILAIIDSTLYAQNARQAQGLYAQAEANYQNAKMNYERNDKLFGQNLIAKQEVDNSKTAYEVAKAQKEAQLASYKNALTQLTYCRITAPFAGYITKRFLDAGAYVTASTTSASSTLFVLMDIGKVKILANLPERNISILGNVKEADVKVDAFKDRFFKGFIARTSEAVDPSTGTMQLEIDVNNSDRILKPGMFATVTFLLEKKEDALTLPLNVVLNDDKGNFVYKFNPDSTVSKVSVKTGLKEVSIVEILEGIGINDKIVVVGQTMIKDKMKVKVAR
jgi:membrane fusion protein (multidrug efflux system)